MSKLPHDRTSEPVRMNIFLDHHRDNFRWAGENSKHKILPTHNDDTGIPVESSIYDAFCFDYQNRWGGGRITKESGRDFAEMVVYAARARESEIGSFSWQMAIKVILDCDAAILKKVLAEIDRLKQVRHPHIVSYVGSCQTQCGTSVAIAMYPLGKMNLQKYMQQVSEELESGVELQQEAWQRLCKLRGFFGCLSRCVSYLHERQDGKASIKHKDIKPTNIIIDFFDSPILTDFGISSINTGIPTIGPSGYTEMYAAPEVLDDQPRGLSTDIFSLGCVFLEIATLIQGYSLKEMDEHLKQNSVNGNIFYGRSVDRLHAWIDKIRTARPVRQINSGKGGNNKSLSRLMADALSEIRRMLSNNPKNRPSSDMLWKTFGLLYQEECPSCCCETSSAHRLLSESTAPSNNFTKPVPLQKDHFPSLGELIIIYYTNTQSYYLKTLHQYNRWLYQNSETEVCRLERSRSWHSRICRFETKKGAKFIVLRHRDWVRSKLTSVRYVFALPGPAAELKDREHRHPS